MSVRLPRGLSEPSPGCSSAPVSQQRSQPAEEDRCMSPQLSRPHPSGTSLSKSAGQREDRQDAHLWSHPRLPGAHSTFCRHGTSGVKPLVLFYLVLGTDAVFLFCLR